MYTKELMNHVVEYIKSIIEIQLVDMVRGKNDEGNHHTTHPFIQPPLQIPTTITNPDFNLPVNTCVSGSDNNNKIQYP